MAKTLGQELEDAGATVVRSTVKIGIIAATVVVALSIFGWWGTKKFKAKREKKALLIANSMASGESPVENELLLMEA